jgi:excisionase family DNA binding protein
LRSGAPRFSTVSVAPRQLIVALNSGSHSEAFRCQWDADERPTPIISFLSTYRRRTLSAFGRQEPQAPRLTAIVVPLLCIAFRIVPSIVVTDLVIPMNADIPFPQRLTCTIAEACQATGLGRTKIYSLISEGCIETVTIGRRRLVLVRSLFKLLEMADQ